MFDSGTDTASSTARSGAEVLAARKVACEEAEAGIVELASHIAAATARMLERVVAMDRAGLIDSPDTMETWLAWRLSLSRRVAKDYVRVAYALEELPQITAAFSAGELSYDKVSSITRIATPDTEDDLLEWAKSGTAAQIAKIVSTYQRAMSASELDSVNDRHAQRFLNHFFDDHGDFILKGRLAPEDGAVVAQALDAYVDSQRDREHTFEQRRADALVAVAEAALEADFEANPNHVERFQVMVHLDADALVTDDPDARAELYPGIPLHPETARRLACDADLLALLHKDGEPACSGRRSRAIPRATRRAMVARDQGCRCPGCTNRRFIDAHHVEHWGHGGDHDLLNLLSLCRRHHRMVHEGGYSIRPGPDGDFEFVHPGGWLIEASPPLGPPTTKFEALNTTTLVETYVDPCDYATAVDALWPKPVDSLN